MIRTRKERPLDSRRTGSGGNLVEAIEFLDRTLDRGTPEIVVFANANTLNAAGSR